jgi:DNA-binding GntR family transcriptional regulator
VPPRQREIPSRRVEADLRRRIEAGEWAAGDPLPSVAALAIHYGVSRTTVSKAQARLAAAGLVEIVPQWGVFVAGDSADSGS